MNSEKLGDLARKFYANWKHRQLNIIDVQEQNMIKALTNTKNYIATEIINYAVDGNKFRRFYYNELDTTHTFNRPINNYEVKLMLRGENFDVTYEKDSFVVRWEQEELK
jgi:hypothetical protein